jgi:hypothetical protein
MVNIVIPEKIEKAVKKHEDEETKRQREYCQNLLTGIDEEILAAYKKVAPTPQLDLLKQSFKNELNRRNQEYLGKPEYNPSLFKPSIFRPNAGLQDPAGKYVTTVQQFAALLENMDESQIEQVQYYSGEDHAGVTLLRARIPEGYVGGIAYVYKRDIPQFAYDRNWVVNMRFVPKNAKKAVKQKRASYMSLCRELSPARTDSNYYDVSKETIHNTYGWVSMKIRNQDQTLVSWFTGLEINCVNMSGEEYNFCLVGAHYTAEGRVSKKPR